MRNIIDIKDRLENDDEINSNLDLLIDYSLSNKSLIFNKDIAGIEFEKLSTSEIVKLQTDKYHIIDFEVFGFKVYSLFKSKIKLTNDFKSFVLLLKEIEADYKSDKFVRNISTLLNELWAIAILDSNQSFGIDFSDYLNSLDAETNRDDIFSFNEGYSRALPFLKIEETKFFQNGIQLIKWTKSDADYNMPLGSFLRGVRNKIYEDEKWGLKCLEFSFNQADLEIDFLIPIITGLYDKLGLIFFNKYLEDKINNETYAVSIICGLSNIEHVKDDECVLIFKVYNKSKKDNTHVLLNLPKLLFAILKSKETDIDKKYIGLAFRCLDELLSIDNPNLIYFILRENEYQDNHLELRNDLILSFIKKPHFKQEYLNSINHFLWKQKDVKLFEIVLYTIGEYLPFKSIERSLSSSINVLQSNHKKEFDKVIVNLLIQDKACYRFLATDILSRLYDGFYTFDYDILELSSLNQYKLWVSVFQNYREPQSVIPCLLPLLKSKSLLVKEAFICKLEEYTESYGGSVTATLKEKLDFEDNDLKEIFERIEDYKVVFYQNNVVVKDEIKELNPAFTQNRLFVEFNKNYNRRFSRQMQKSSEENSSFLNFCSKVTLLKGGGWKIDGRDEISKLSEISTSFSLPRMYFIRPENFDFETSVEMFTNWSETNFAEIKRILDNE
ncbi:hypothetical protein DWB61_17260 [Ancylomarina euxinus]|uniref:Uncharacterized protein n=1 Tax=Ancylomarina euxinus TaxID=2283627 RepID=A0A425XWI1_9BACT|nr:hypothetical protein [Ancylomarina euxinus]MCZ4696414.1 hypothetical protein [Ancylomarina euxinus]RRG19007.1 hypothetical protein DWB61_17260 [Ancylomarina euxinus]